MLNESNYNSAVSLLQDRYGKPQHIISAHMEEIIKLPACSGEKHSALRYVYDKVNADIRGLDSLGIRSDHYGSLLIPIIMTKLLQELQLRIARETEREVWQIDELMAVIKKVEAREATEFVKLHQPKTPVGCRGYFASPPTAATLVASGSSIRCVYCKGAHYSASCAKFRTPQERRTILMQTGRCFNCLKNNHKSRECESTKTCRYCNGKHHQSICGKVSSNDVHCRNQPSDTSSQSSSNMGTSVTSGNTVDNGVTLTSANTTSVSKKHQTILLQTAHAMVRATPDGPSVPVRLLFDNGSQLS